MATTEEITSKAARLRGYVLNYTIHIDRQIDYFLSKHFTDTEYKQIELANLIFANDRLSFETKRGVFDLIVKKHYADFHASNKDVFSELTNIQTERNRFAHGLVDLSPEAFNKFDQTKEVGFIKFKEKPETNWYTDDRIEEIAKSCIKVVNKLKEFI